MEQILQKFSDICDEPYQYLSQWKQANQRKVIACYPMYVPEEIIHAAGALPFIIQRSTERIAFADRFFQAYYCDFGRSSFDLILRGVLDFADGIVRGDTCYVNTVIAYMMPYVRSDFYTYDIIMVKALDNPSAQAYLFEELERFKANFGEFMGAEITDEQLWKSIKVYNENRALVRKLYDLRRSNPGLIKAREMLAVVKASMLMPKEEHSQYLVELLAQLEKREPSNIEGKVKLLLSGTLCEDTRLDILDFVEDLGGVVVDDDLYMGSRYVAVDCESAATPMESIAQRYLNMIPCPTRFKESNDYGEYLVNLTRKVGAQAVVILLVFHCEPHWFAYPLLKEKLRAAGIPHYYLEMEQESLSLGKIRTKMEAFMEMVKGGK